MLGAEQFLGFSAGKGFFAFIILWSLLWKGLALWKAARVGTKPWFIVLLLVNSFGLLEIIYFFAVKPREKLDFSWLKKIIKKSKKKKED